MNFIFDLQDPFYGNLQ